MGEGGWMDGWMDADPMLIMHCPLKILRFSKFYGLAHVRGTPCNFGTLRQIVA